MQDQAFIIKGQCIVKNLNFYHWNLSIHKSMAPNEMYPRVLRELADIVTKSLLMIFEKSWQPDQVPEDCKKGNIAPILKESKKDDSRNY